MAFVDNLREKGIVGAGGAGFPSHVKLSSPADTVIVNGAECEPLLHKDKEILTHKSKQFFAGLQYLIKAVSAKKAIISVKKKHAKLIKQLQPQLAENMTLFPLADFYPAGDEITLIHETCGVVIEAGQLPISKGFVVNNVETVFNMGGAGPVVSKFLNVAGLIKKKNSFEVPLGISFREIIDFAEPLKKDYEVLAGGPMMGKLVDDLDQPVTKTTSALLLLPKDHVLVSKYRTMASEKQVNRIGKSACDQCSFCTELCPRYLLGHPIQPHMAMRALSFASPDIAIDQSQSHALFCCGCNLCSFISCPEGLFPGSVCMNLKSGLGRKSIKYRGDTVRGPHPLADYRRTPVAKLKQMLDLSRFSDTGPLAEFTYQPKVLKLALQQHIGAPAEPIVDVGKTVHKAQKIASVGTNLGAEIHAPADGHVASITTNHIIIRTNGE